MRTAAGLTISDSRACAVAPEHVLGGLDAEIYWFCDSARSLVGVSRAFAARAREAQVREALDRFVAQKLMVSTEGQYLSLAVLRNRPAQVSQDIHSERQDAYIQLTQAPAPQSLLHPV